MRLLTWATALLSFPFWSAANVQAQNPEQQLHRDPEVNLPTSQIPVRGTAAQCIGVTSGDTISVILKNPATKGTNNRPVTVHLYAVTAPALGQNYGTQARDYTHRLVLNRPVTLYQKGKDHSGRIQAWVFVGTLSVNRELVLNGYAHWDRAMAPQEAKLRDFENEARLRHRGLWRTVRTINPRLESSSNNNSGNNSRQ